MERREQYDPEDIESLLTERSFDELLSEERAFVLRHLSGRDEYEQMRALLHHVRPDERGRPTIEPEDRVRSNVLAAFRAQQQPQWRVWLNSVAVWLAPRDASAFWRPALAFGSLALLIVAGFVAVRQFGNETSVADLAELKEVPAHEKNENSPAPPAELEQMDTVGSLVIMHAEGSRAAASVSERPTEFLSAEVGPAREEFHLDLDEKKDAPQFDPSATADAVMMDKENGTGATTKYEVNGSLSSAPPVSDTAPVPTGHVVTQEELMRNQSVANVAETAKVSPTRKRAAQAEKVADDGASASRSLGQDQALMGLIYAGW